MSADDFLSPFEELVLTALTEHGHGACDHQICHQARLLSGRERILLKRVIVALAQLERDYCVHSWPDGFSMHEDGSPVKQYRVQYRGQRALDAAIERRGNVPARDYFYRASRFGILWDFCRGIRCRIRAERRAWSAIMNGRGEKI